jgi:hypothetical protein
VRGRGREFRNRGRLFGWLERLDIHDHYDHRHG